MGVGSKSIGKMDASERIAGMTGTGSKTLPVPMTKDGQPVRRMSKLEKEVRTSQQLQKLNTLKLPDGVLDAAITEAQVSKSLAKLS